MGQVIDLGPAVSDAQKQQAAPKPTTVAAAAGTSTNTAAEWTRSLASMSTEQLITAFMSIQGDRVRTYARFDACLDTMLGEHRQSAGGDGTQRQQQQHSDKPTSNAALTGGCMAYPALCGEMTATFAALSTGARSVCTALSDRGAAAAAAAVTCVQRLEEQKLTATAALHLERMRRETHYFGEGAADGAAAKLLEGGATELKSRLTRLAADISDALEELRYELE